MCSHFATKIIAGSLICTLCGMNIYELIENKNPLPHIPEKSKDNIYYPVQTYNSASTISPYIIQSYDPLAT